MEERKAFVHNTKYDECFLGWEGSFGKKTLPIDHTK